MSSLRLLCSLNVRQICGHYPRSAAMSTFASSSSTLLGRTNDGGHAIEGSGGQQVRYRKRRGILMQKVAMARKRQKEAEERANPPPPKLTFIERVTSFSKAGKTRSLAEQFPQRLGFLQEGEDKEELPPPPDVTAKTSSTSLNVHLMSDYQPRVYSITDALKLHRQLMDKTIYNIPDAPVRLRLELTMTTERKTRFVPEQSMVIDIPHLFPHNEKRTIMAFVKDPAMIEAAQEAGADHIGTVELSKKITKGLFRTDDYEYIVAHTEIITEIMAMRGMLKKKFPTKLNGGLGDDIVALINRFKDGVQYKIQGDVVYQKYGVCDTVVGNLSMSDEELEANMIKVIEEVAAVRAPRPDGEFIHRALVMLKVPLASYNEHYAVHFSQFTPPLPTQEEFDRKKHELKLAQKNKKRGGRNVAEAPVPVVMPREEVKVEEVNTEGEKVEEVKTGEIATP